MVNLPLATAYLGKAFDCVNQYSEGMVPAKNEDGLLISATSEDPSLVDSHLTLFVDEIRKAISTETMRVHFKLISAFL